MASKHLFLCTYFNAVRSAAFFMTNDAFFAPMAPASTTWTTPACGTRHSVGRVGTPLTRRRKIAA